MGLAVKTATVFPGNADSRLPTVNGVVNLFSDLDGSHEATIDFHLVTKWKTAGDSLLAARLLARPDSRTILIVGAGTVGWSLREAYGSLFPDARFMVWNRSPDRAERLAALFRDTDVVRDLGAAVTEADIISCATMVTDPLIRGEWLRPGQHLDLIGAYRSDMREADDTALERSRIFVDSRDTTIDHIGELTDPIGRGVITRDSVIADFYDLSTGSFTRAEDDEITLFKNGGGAHLDLMIARHVLDTWRGDSERRSAPDEPGRS
jgi:ornithine cyclodeaminase